MLPKILIFFTVLGLVSSGKYDASFTNFDTFTYLMLKSGFEIFDQLYPSIPIKIEDPETYMSVPEVIKYNGYVVEKHAVTTQDEYVLEMHRIPFGLSGRMSKPNRPVVLLNHGFASSSAQWVLNFENGSLGFILADAGYDVWMGNFRGNSYTSHKQLATTDAKFWAFSYEQMGTQDLPSQIDYILRQTKQSQISYVGHSMASTAMFVLLSEKPEYNQKLRNVVALAPSVFLEFPTAVQLFLVKINLEVIAMERMGINRVFPKGFFFQLLSGKPGYLYHLDLSTMMSSFFIGFDLAQINITRLPVYYGQLPEAVSLHMFRHLYQTMRSRRFERFESIGNPEADEFDLSKVTAPVSILWSPNDFACGEQTVQYLETRLPNLRHTIRVRNNLFTYIDFAIGLKAKELVYDDILKILLE